MMSLLENKHLHALAAWIIVVAIILSVGLPAQALFGASLDGQSRLSDKQDVIASLEQRIHALQKPSASKMIDAMAVEPEKGAAAQIVVVSCNILAESHAKLSNTITAPCQSSQTPLNDQFTVYTSEIRASGTIENLLTALDNAELGESRLAEFDLSTDEGPGGDILRLKFAIIGAPAEAPAQ